MRSRFSSFLRGLMVALLLLAGEQMAVARGASAATGLAYLCSGGMMVIVPVDAEGQPSGLPHLCPDAIQNFAGLLDPLLRPVAPQSRLIGLIEARERGDVAPLSVIADLRARGPPLYV